VPQNPKVLVKSPTTSGVRYSIADLLVVLAVVAVGCAALVGESSGWPWIMSQLTAFLFGWAALQAIYSRFTRRFWVGFLVFGVANMLWSPDPFGSSRAEGLMLEWIAMTMRLHRYSSETLVTLSYLVTICFATAGGLIAVLVDGHWRTRARTSAIESDLGA